MIYDVKGSTFDRQVIHNRNTNINNMDVKTLKDLDFNFYEE